jgi:epsilon-lactone hydrolase
MSVFRLALVNFWLRHVGKRYLAREADFTRARRSWESTARMMPGRHMDLVRRPLAGNGRAVEAGWIEGPAEGPLLLWLHGGAYCMGSAVTHAAMVGALARRLGGRAVIPEYRLAPEHPFPAAIEDALCAYRALVAEGLPRGGIVLGGDSAGGGLAFALLHILLQEGLPLPRSVVAFSPWVDLTQSGESLRTLADRDVMLPVERFGEIRDAYLAGADPRDPRASPAFGCFAGGPPVLIFSSEHEALRDDARTMAARLREHGVVVTHREWPGLPHVWPLFLGLLPEAATTLDESAAFVAANPVSAGEPRGRRAGAGGRPG